MITRPISVHVDDEDYRSLKTLAERSGKPVAELIREAMAEYLSRREGGGSLFDLAPHPREIVDIPAGSAPPA